MVTMAPIYFGCSAGLGKIISPQGQPAGICPNENSKILLTDNDEENFLRLVVKWNEASGVIARLSYSTSRHKFSPKICSRKILIRLALPLKLY